MHNMIVFASSMLKNSYVRVFNIVRYHPGSNHATNTVTRTLQRAHLLPHGTFTYIVVVR